MHAFVFGEVCDNAARLGRGQIPAQPRLEQAGGLWSSNPSMALHQHFEG
jgi:hypothetical protein